MMCIVGSEGQPSPPFFVAAGECLNAVAFQALLRGAAFLGLWGLPWWSLCHLSGWGALPCGPKYQAASGGQYGRLLAASALTATVALPPPAGVQHVVHFLGPGPGKLHAKFGSPKGLQSAAVGSAN